MKLNDEIKGPDPSYVDAMSVVVTGGTPEDRLAVKSVIFNALEGAEFRQVNYLLEDVPYAIREVGGQYNQVIEPVEDARSILEMCAELNPLLFYTSITLESHPSLAASGHVPEEVRQGRWPEDEQVQKPAANDSVREVVIEGTVRFKF
jgi:hypothetical protein